jgi:hypothetical protein
MARNEQTRFWPYPDNQNQLAMEMLLHEQRDPAKRTLPATIPGPTVDAEGRTLADNDPRRSPQRFDTFVPIVIDDVVAEALLTYNTVNRKPSKNNVRELTQTILQGEWCFNGLSSTLPFSNTALLDKQHTLQSVINAFAIGRANNTLVSPLLSIPIIGLHPSVFDTFDCGRQRTTKDTLYVGARLAAVDLMDINESVWSHAIRLQTQYANLTQELEPDNPFYMENMRDRLPNNRVLELFQMSPQLQTSVEYCSGLGIPTTRALISLAVIATVHAIIAEIQSTSAANGFVRGLALGANIDEKSPVHQLREQIIRDKSRPNGSRIEGIDMLAMCIRTWNNVAQHKEATSRRIRALNHDGSFPLPVPIQRRAAGITR